MMQWPDYAAHEFLVAPARKTAELWRFAAGFIAAFALYLILNQLLFQGLYTVMGQADAFAFYGDLLSGSTPVAMLIILFSFATMIVAVAVPVRVLHKRSVGSLLGPIILMVPQFRVVLVVLVILSVVVFVLPPWDIGAPFVPNVPPGQWVLLLPLALAGVLIQVSAEEIVFRGYLQQQLAARFASPLVWMVVPSVLFALGHHQPDVAGSNAWLITIWAGFFGMLMADLTARSGSLGPAIALHFVNNVSAIVIVSLPEDLSGLSLFTTPFGMDDTEVLRAWLPVDFAMMLVMWLGARLALRR